MIYKNLIRYIDQLFLTFSQKFKNIYLNSNIYNNKISKFYNINFEYRSSSSLLDCLIKYEKKKNKIENYALDSIWINKKIKEKDYKKLHSFFLAI